MTAILNLFSTVGDFALPIFVFLTMLNVGLTQKPEDFKQYLSEKNFFIRMLATNFLVAPFVMWLLLQIFSPSDPTQIGLIIFSMTAGAPFLIKLTQYSDNDVALGATLMLVLVIGTIVFAPFLIPAAISGVEIDGLQIILTLSRQLVLPIILGMVLHYFWKNFAEKIQPWVGKIGNIVLWIVVIGVLVGNLDGIIPLLGEGALATGILFILIMTFLAYFLAGTNNADHLQEVGAIGTGQRNTAASMIIASGNFADTPEVLVIITMVNTIGLVMLIYIAKLMNRDDA